MRIVVISKESFFKGESDSINRLFDAGMSVLHLRKPNAEVKDIRKLLSEISPEFLNRISLHQFHEELAPEFGIKRLHFKENKRHAVNAFELELLRDKGFALSTSVHNAADLDSLSPAFEYCFLGPMFESLSKPGYAGRQFRLKKLYPFKVLAIGGITPYKIDLVTESGFDGIALLGYLWNDEHKAVGKFSEVVEKWVLSDQLS